MFFLGLDPFFRVRSLLVSTPRPSGALHLHLLALRPLPPRVAAQCQPVLQLDALRTARRTGLARGRLARARPRLGPRPQHEQPPTSSLRTSRTAMVDVVDGAEFMRLRASFGRRFCVYSVYRFDHRNG